MTDIVLGTTLPAGVTDAVQRMRDDAREGREDSMDRLRKVRRGEFALVWPDYFSDKFPTAIVANFVDQAARDLAANLSPLPSLACSAGQMRTDADRRRAERKNRIGASYWRHAGLVRQMKYGADQYLSYGFLPVWVEADYAAQTPLIHIEDPVGAYFEVNRKLETERYAKCWRDSIDKLAAQFPEYAGRILYDQYGRRYQDPNTEVVRYIDKQYVVLYLPERQNMVVAAYEHGLNFCPVHIAFRPGVEIEPRGQFDDVLWVQLAHTVMAALTLEAGHKAVQAPIVAPTDVQEIAIGPDAVMLTDNGDKVGRINLEVPQAAFALGQELRQEMQEGVGYPNTRLGYGPPGGSTGRGISALEGGFDTQIKLGQDVLGEMLRIVSQMCFKMDVTLWPNITKKIEGTLSGESYSLTYTPSVDIGDNTECEITYGFASGLSPNAAIVTLLQLRGDNVISRDTFRRQLPFDIDVDQQKRDVLEQEIEDAAMQGLAAALQASGQMLAQGQTQEAITFWSAAVNLIQGIRKGRDLADLIDEVLVQPAQQQIAQQQEQQQAAIQAAAGQAGGQGAPGGGDALDGVAPNGLPSGVAPGQAALPPGGRPSILDLTAGFSGSGAPALNAGIRRRIATG